MNTCILCGAKQSTYQTGPCDRCLAVMERNREAAEAEADQPEASGA